MRGAIITALLAACAMPAINASAPLAAQRAPATDPHLGPQPTPDAEVDHTFDITEDMLDQLEGMKLDDAEAKVRGWRADVRIELEVEDTEYSKRRDAIVRCFEGIVCGAHFGASEMDRPVYLEVGPKPEVGGAPPPP